MLNQLFNIVKRFGQDTVVNNPEIPNEYNQEVMAEASDTIASGFQNVIAGGGLSSILDLFKGRSNSRNTSTGGMGGLLKNPIVSMMVGFFISKLVNKFRMNPSSATKVANNLIPASVNDLIEQTNDPNNENVTMDGIVNSVIGKEAQDDRQGTYGSSPLQDILDKFMGGNSDINGDGKFNLQDVIARFTHKAQNNIGSKKEGGGFMDRIKGFFANA